MPICHSTTPSCPSVPMSDDDHVRLLHGPYTAPPLRRRDRASCLFRGGEVVITGWSDAPIPWPRCRVLGGHRGGSGLLVNEELARAVRCESVLAIRFLDGPAEWVARVRRAGHPDGHRPHSAHPPCFRSGSFRVSLP